MRFFSLTLIILATLSSCLNKPNSIEKETLPKISPTYRAELESLITKNPKSLEDHKLTLIKFKLISEILQTKHPLYEQNVQKIKESHLLNTLNKLDPFHLLFNKEDIDELIILAPKEEQQLLTPPVIFLHNVEKKAKLRITELELLSKIFIKEKFLFNEERNLYLGTNPPIMITKAQWTDHWFTYLACVLTQLAADKTYSIKEAQNKEIALKKELETFVKSFIESQNSKFNDLELLTNTSLNSIVNSIDESSVYLSPDSADGFTRTLSLDTLSLGFSFKIDLNSLIVTDVSPDGPSFDKLKIGDAIISVRIKDQIYSFTNIHKLIHILDNPPAEELSLTIKNQEIEKSITLTSTVKSNEEKALQYFIFRNNKKELLAYIKLPKFYQTTLRESDSLDKKFTNIALRLSSLGVKGVVLDLRDNSGGSFSAAFSILSVFLPNGPVLQEKTIDKTIQHKLTEHNVAFDGKLVVLVNEISASSSEILANAIQERRRGLIVGTTTFGKGSIQEIINLGSSLLNYPDLSSYANKVGSIKITRASFHKLDGIPIHNLGVSPDIQINSMSSSINKLKPLNFPKLDAIDYEYNPIKELIKLQSNSQERQNKSPIFTEIKKLQNEQARLIHSDDWMFSNLEKYLIINKEKEDLDNKIKKLKTNINLDIVIEDTNLNTLGNSIQKDPIAVESIKILEDYIDD